MGCTQSTTLTSNHQLDPPSSSSTSPSEETLTAQRNTTTSNPIPPPPMTSTAEQVGTIRHFATFGYPSSRTTKRAVASDWKTEQYTKPISSPWNIKIPQSDLQQLLMGSIPEEMENKWFVYADGPDDAGEVAIHFIRSWTGYRIATIEGNMKDPENCEITGLIWESNEKLVNHTLEECKDSIREVCRWILGVQLPPEVGQEVDAEED